MLYDFIKLNIYPVYLPTDLSNLLHSYKIKFHEIQEKIKSFEITIIAFIMK